MIDGVLVIYFHPLTAYAPTVMDHVRAFGKYSSAPVWAVNIAEGFPPGLRDLQFRVIVLHYSLFGTWPHVPERDAFLYYAAACTDTYKIAFFQDEHQYCQQRFAFLNEARIDCVYSLLDPSEVPKVYGRHTAVPEVRHTLTGYVPEDLVAKARRWAKPVDRRSIDVGYRARPLAYFMGRAAQEKTAIADEFVRRAAGTGLELDIKTAEEDRIYGDDWYRFVADCRAMIGVEAGVSVFDLDGSARRACETLLAAEPDLCFEEVHARVLHEYEDRVHYRTISPRVFEAAAFRTLQILFEGRYNDVIEPMVHYVPLKKDFSNFAEVMRVLADPEAVRRITDRAYEDLIASGNWSFRSFITEFDAHLVAAVGTLSADANVRKRVTRALAKGRARRLAKLRARDLRIRLVDRLHQPFPGKRALRPILRPLANWLFRS